MLHPVLAQRLGPSNHVRHELGTPERSRIRPIGFPLEGLTRGAPHARHCHAAEPPKPTLVAGLAGDNTTSLQRPSR